MVLAVGGHAARAHDHVQYLYAAFSLKRDPAEGLTAEQAAATERWRQVITDIAIEEMLHLALVVQPDVGHRRGAHVQPA